MPAPPVIEPGPDPQPQAAGPVPADLIAVGRVTESYGLRGWVKVAPYNDPPDSVLRHCRHWWFADGTGVAIDRARIHGATIVCKPAGTEDRNDALAYRNREVMVSREEFPAAVGDEVYWVDLVGCRVTGAQGTDFGTVTAVEDYGAHPILKVADAQGRETMVPFVSQWLVSVDVPGRLIVTDWPSEI